MKILVIGEAPSKWQQDRNIKEPLPLAGRELAQLAGLRWPDQWFENFDVVNVLDMWPGRNESGQGDAFPLDVARPAAKELLQRLWGRRLILLGRRIENAFRLCHVDKPWFTWHSFGIGEDTISYAVAPHPSHVSRWWNLIENREAARKFWTSCVTANVA